MTAAQPVIFSGLGLSPGERIEVWREGTALHRGMVLETLPAMDLLWILDECTSSRQLLDLDLLRILGCTVRILPERPDRKPAAA